MTSSGTAAMRVLCIDDEARADSARVDLLESYGCEISVVSNVRDLEGALGDGLVAYDVVLLDLMMPPNGFASLDETKGGKSTGVVVLRRIRRVAPRIPIVVLTARTHERASLDLAELRQDVSALLVKPVMTSVLFDALRKAVEVGGRR